MTRQTAPAAPPQSPVEAAPRRPTVPPYLDRISEAKAAHDQAHDAYVAHLDACGTTPLGRWCLACYELCKAANGAGSRLEWARTNARRMVALHVAIFEARAARLAAGS